MGQAVGPVFPWVTVGVPLSPPLPFLCPTDALPHSSPPILGVPLIPPQFCAPLQSVFRKFDLDKSGSMSAYEMRMALEASGN